MERPLLGKQLLFIKENIYVSIGKLLTAILIIVWFVYHTVKMARAALAAHGR